MIRTIFLLLAIAPAGNVVVVDRHAFARSTNGCDTQDNEGSDHGNGHDAFCDANGYE
jgi:hypothetical protein